MSRSMRRIPWLSSLLAAVLVLTVRPAGDAIPSRSEVGREEAREVLSATPTPDRDGDCGDLYGLSARAAALTGSLALVGPEERPAQARRAAAEIRGLAVRAAGVKGGEALAGVLEALADGLERYGSGDPAGLAAVQAASETNRRIRAAYGACTAGQLTNGGEGDE